MSRRSGISKDSDKQKKVKLSLLNDDEIEKFLNSIEDDDDDEIDLDNSIEDPDYRCDELEPEDNEMISDCLQVMDSSTFMNAINLSINVSTFSLNPTDVQHHIPSIDDNASSDNTPRAESSIDLSERQKIEATTSMKSKKRARSPLPIIESSGPQVTPSSGGFTGSG